MIHNRSTGHFDHDEHSDLRGVVVMVNGEIVAERYYNGETADTLHDIRCAGKSITSPPVGVAIDRKKTSCERCSRLMPVAPHTGNHP